MRRVRKWENRLVGRIALVQGFYVVQCEPRDGHENMVGARRSRMKAIVSSHHAPKERHNRICPISPLTQILTAVKAAFDTSIRDMS